MEDEDLVEFKLAKVEKAVKLVKLAKVEKVVNLDKMEKAEKADKTDKVEMAVEKEEVELADHEVDLDSLEEETGDGVELQEVSRDLVEDLVLGVHGDVEPQVVENHLQFAVVQVSTSYIPCL